MPLLASVENEQVKEGVLIVVPAKDEQDSIGKCLKQLAELKGLERYKVVAVNDRSADQTGAKIRALSSQYPDLIEALDITELPSGWLGKNHACWKGVMKGFEVFPEAQYVLFTDGDVKFHPDTVSESITWMKKRKIDFMTLVEDAEYEGIIEPAYLMIFGVFLIFFSARPWLLHKAGGKNFMGNGAYLLARREAYEKTRGHEALKLEVVEDMRMGLLMRRSGYHCAAAVGVDRIKRRWQPGFRAIFKGLLKNAFAGFEYNILFVCIGILFFPLVFLLPWLLILSGHLWLGLPNLFAIMVLFFLAGKNSRMPWGSGFLFSPMTSLVASINLATSAVMVLRDGGVSWRGTLYPLAELKMNCLTIQKAFKR